MDALRGIWLILRTPRLWGLSFGPLAGAVLVYTLLGIVGGFLFVPRLHELVTRQSGSDITAGIVDLLAVVAWLLLFPFAFLVFGGILHGIFYERLSHAVSLTQTPNAAPDTPLTPGKALQDGIARFFLNLLLSVLALALTPFLGPIPGILAAALIGLLDFTSPAYQRRGLTLGAQFAALGKQKASRTLSFALISGLLSLVPLVGVFLIPAFVAGGTLLAETPPVKPQR